MSNNTSNSAEDSDELFRHFLDALNSAGSNEIETSVIASASSSPQHELQSEAAVHGQLPWNSSASNFSPASLLPNEQVSHQFVPPSYVSGQAWPPHEPRTDFTNLASLFIANSPQGLSMTGMSNYPHAPTVDSMPHHNLFQPPQQTQQQNALQQNICQALNELTQLSPAITFDPSAHRDSHIGIGSGAVQPILLAYPPGGVSTMSDHGVQPHQSTADSIMQLLALLQATSSATNSTATARNNAQANFLTIPGIDHRSTLGTVAISQPMANPYTMAQLQYFSQPNAGFATKSTAPTAAPPNEPNTFVAASAGAQPELLQALLLRSLLQGLSPPFLAHNGPPAVASLPVAVGVPTANPSLGGTSLSELELFQVKNKELRTKAFPIKLHKILCDATEEGKEDVISWTPSGAAFKVHNRDRFTAEIMPNYFRMSKTSSYRRQLSMYGFKRIRKGPEQGAYMHKLFRRDKPELACSIHRVPDQKIDDKLPPKVDGMAGDVGHDGRHNGS